MKKSNSTIAMQQIIANEKTAHAAQVKVAKCIEANKTEILTALKNEVFDFLELIQLDDTFQFRIDKCRLLTICGTHTPKQAVDWYRQYIIAGNHFLLSSINHYVRFRIDDSFTTSIILERCVDYGTNIETHFTNVADFAKAFTTVCLNKVVNRK